MTINFQIIGHHEQRYSTVGDYWVDSDGVWQFRVSRLNDGRYEWLVFIHELVEAVYCWLRSIPLNHIDTFDLLYEDARKAGRKKAPCGCKIQEEPGFDKHAPYRKGHKLADICERLVAKALKVKWKQYEAEIASLE